MKNIEKNQKCKKARKNRQKFRKIVQNAKKPRENRQKYRKETKNIEKL